MSARATALAQTVDPNTRAYVQALLEAERDRAGRESSRLAKQIVTLQSQLRAARAEIEELRRNAQTAESPDPRERYALTKAKLIRLMRENGWLDDATE